MKKTLIILTMIGMVFSSCSSDGNNGEANLPISFNNLAGNWNVSKLIKADGSQVDYINLCSTQKDYVKFYTYDKMEFYQFYTNCNPLYMYEQCSNFYFEEGDILSNCANLVDGKIIKFTATELIIDYQETRVFGYIDNNLQEANGIVLIRE